MISNEAVFFRSGPETNGKLLEDKLTIVYVGKGRTSDDVAAFQTTHPLNKHDYLCYYEITVLDVGQSGMIGVGYSDAQFNGNRQPGWDSSSYGYHGDDGRKYHHSSRGESFGPTFARNDVIGCGYNYLKKQIFYTINGKFFNVAFNDVSKELYPTVGLHSPREKIEANFGQKPFKFDILRMKAELAASIESPSASSVFSNANGSMPLRLHDIVAEYLAYHGYLRSYEAFTSTMMTNNKSTTTATTTSPNRNMNANTNEISEDKSRCVASRDEIATLIRAGKVQEAYDIMTLRHQPILADSSNIYLLFLFHSQIFIELIRQRQVMPALVYAQKHFPGFNPPNRTGLSNNGITKQSLTELMGLLVYDDVASSPLAHLLSPTRRVLLIENINKAFYNNKIAMVDTLVNSLKVVYDTIRENGGGAPVIPLFPAPSSLSQPSSTPSSLSSVVLINKDVEMAEND